jgi:hypothetical protein
VKKLTTTKLIKKLEHKRDDVVYTIYVEQEGDAIWGTWSCHECGTGGSGHTKVTTLDAAIQSAKDDLERHHMANHQMMK